MNQYQACLYSFECISHGDFKYGDEIVKCWPFWKFCDIFDLSSAHTCRMEIINQQFLWKHLWFPQSSLPGKTLDESDSFKSQLFQFPGHGSIVQIYIPIFWYVEAILRQEYYIHCKSFIKKKITKQIIHLSSHLIIIYSLFIQCHSFEQFLFWNCFISSVHYKSNYNNNLTDISVSKYVWYC